MRTWGRQAGKGNKRSSSGTVGMTLPEVLIASSLAVLLLGLPLTWSIQGQQVIKACTVRSEELQELNQAMKAITETLQDGAVYLLEPHSPIVTFGSDGSLSQPWTPLSLQGPSSAQDPSLSAPGSRLLVECFVNLYKRKEGHEFLLRDGYLFQRIAVKGPHGSKEEAGNPSGVLLETGEEERLVASNIEEIAFSCPVRGILEITIQGETVLLTTQVRVKEGKEDE